MSQHAVVLFDLDGTLTDSAAGIIGSLRRAFDVHGLPQLTPEQARSMLGPPFTKSLPAFVAPELVDEVIATYRGFYSSGGMFEAPVYDGIPELLEQLRRRGTTLAVATSKVEAYAVPILQSVGLFDYFDTVCGDDFDASRDSKALVIGEALRRLAHPDPATVLMVGDRVHDVEGSAQHGIRCAGAGWGYGSPAELAGAQQWYARPVDLLRDLE